MSRMMGDRNHLSYLGSTLWMIHVSHAYMGYIQYIEYVGLMGLSANWIPPHTILIEMMSIEKHVSDTS